MEKYIDIVIEMIIKTLNVKKRIKNILKLKTPTLKLNNKDGRNKTEKNLKNNIANQFILQYSA